MSDLPSTILEAVEHELKRQVARLNHPSAKPFQEMLAYHMGWSGEGAGREAGGKRIRPMLLLLTTAGCGADWLPALPAAAAIELVHNFSLVHDDIQDRSEKRRGRTTVWKRWGMAQGINVGDALFVLAMQAILDVSHHYDASTAVRAARLLHRGCLDLTRGQFLDLSYENRQDLTLEDYWPMIEGKTAALLATSTQLGAILAGAEEERQEQYRLFGERLGLAFQVLDDILGIWGDEALTGKSNASDLVEGKNSLPVLYGIGRRGRFAQRWARRGICPEEVLELAQVLREEGAYDFCQKEARRLTHQALEALQRARPQGEAGKALETLARKLLKRQS